MDFAVQPAFDESKLIEGPLTKEIIGAAIEVHRLVGLGLLESAYEICMCHELAQRGVKFQRQVDIPVFYKVVALDCGYKLDVLVDERVILELKAIEAILPVHEAQLLTYLWLSGKRVGFILNFHVPQMRKGILRKVL